MVGGLVDGVRDEVQRDRTEHLDHRDEPQVGPQRIAPPGCGKGEHQVVSGSHDMAGAGEARADQSSRLTKIEWYLPPLDL